MTNPCWEVENYFDGSGGALFGLYCPPDIHSEVHRETRPVLPDIIPESNTRYPYPQINIRGPYVTRSGRRVVKPNRLELQAIVRT